MSDQLSDPVELADRLGPIEDRLLALDFDGVLAPIVDTPDAARASPETSEALLRVAERTAVAIISGRPVDDLRHRVGQVPVTWVGGHGAEIIEPDGSRDHLVDLASVAPTLDGLETDLAELVGEQPGWLIERKEASLAVHHRLADPEDVDELLPRVTAQFEARRDIEPGFQVLHGKAVVELRPTGTDKGVALARIAAHHLGRSPLVLGDDVTDEDAFRVARELGGTGVLVADEPRDTAAEFRLADPVAVTAFLSALARSR